MKFIKFYIVIILFKITACNSIKPPEFVKLQNIIFTKQVNGDIFAEAVLVMRNEALISYSGSDINFKVFYKNKQIANGTCIGPVSFDKNVNQCIKSSIVFHTDLLLNNLNDLLQKDSILLNVKVNGLFSDLKININASIDTYIKTNDLLNSTISSFLSDSSFKVEKLFLKKIELNNSVIEHHIRFTNPLPMEYTLNSIEFNVFGDDQKHNKVAIWSNSYNKTILPNTTDTIQGSIILNNANTILTGIFKTISGNNTYYIVGKVKILFQGKIIEVPINIQFVLDLINQKVILKQS